MNSILESRKASVGKGLEYRVNWAKHEPTWESEKTLRPNLNELLDNFVEEVKDQAVTVIVTEEAKVQSSESKQSS